MKIALFTNEFPPNIYGGAGVHVDFLSSELATLSEVQVHCFGNQQEDRGNMHVRGIDAFLSNMKQENNPHIKMTVSLLAQNLHGSEIIKIAGEINELKRQGQNIANLTIGDFDSNIYPIPAELLKNKTSIKIKIAANYKKTAGRIFGVRTIKQ